MEKILVFGHKNPDTDAICSSLVMADLQTKIRGEEVISCRLGNLNEETKYALNYFKVEEPKLILLIVFLLMLLNFLQTFLCYIHNYILVL